MRSFVIISSHSGSVAETVACQTMELTLTQNYKLNDRINAVISQNWQRSQRLPGNGPLVWTLKCYLFDIGWLHNGVKALVLAKM